MKIMQKERLSLSHQKLLETRFKALNLDLSEYSFANLYLFRHLHQYELIFADELYIQGLNREGSSFIMLTSRPQQAKLPQLLSLLNSNSFLFPIPDQWLELFGSYLNQVSFKEDDSDYLFQTSKLAQFQGRHLSKKRNLVKQLFSNHVVEVYPLQEKKEEALMILNEWQEEQLRPAAETDYLSCKEAIELHEILSLEGRIFYIDGYPSGLTIGERLNDRCFVIHFAKAHKRLNGLYQYLYQEQAQFLGSHYDWINLEQDLGSPALRQAKHSYLPDRMIHKMRVYLKNPG